MKHKNRKNRGTLHSNVICAYSEPDESLLTVSTAPFIVSIKQSHYLNLSLKNEQNQKIQKTKSEI